jgi:hypothetical protein
MKINVVTNRYDNSRSGLNEAETQLNPSNVAVATFGKLFTRTVDGDLYAQPLIVSCLSFGRIERNVVFLATSRNWVYAYDATLRKLSPFGAGTSARPSHAMRFFPPI